jgi:hypothetical protein
MSQHTRWIVKFLRSLHRAPRLAGTAQDLGYSLRKRQLPPATPILRYTDTNDYLNPGRTASRGAGLCIYQLNMEIPWDCIAPLLKGL